LLPQFIRAADNFDSRRPSHSCSFRIGAPRNILLTGIFLTHSRHHNSRSIKRDCCLTARHV
jgi:hypothetical protein